MQIKANINSVFEEMELHVCKNVLDDEVKRMLSSLHELLDTTVGATDERGNRVSLKPSEIYSFYAEGQKVFALSKDEKYIVTKKLYELEEEMKDHFFVRISKSELVNIKKIKCLDMNMTGTIRLIMKNDYETFTSRRNVTKIKKMLVKEE